MKKLNRLSKGGLILIIVPFFILIAFYTGLIPPGPSTPWAFNDILGPAIIVIGFLMLFLGIATMDIKIKKKEKNEKIRFYKKEMNFGCPDCELASSTGMKECPDCGTKL